MFEQEWQRKMKTEFVYSVVPGTFGTAKIDAVAARHLEKWQRHVQLSLASLQKGH